MEGNYGHWNFDGSNDYFDLPDFDAGGGHNDYGGIVVIVRITKLLLKHLMVSKHGKGSKLLSCSMEMIVKQVGTNKGSRNLWD